MVKFLNRRSTWRGNYIDLWTIPHFISGIVIGYIIFFFDIEFVSGFWIALSIGIGWELFERITHLSRTEAYTNSLSDIVAAQIGFVGAYCFLEKFNSPTTEAPIIIFLCVTFGALCLLGWRAYKYYG
ncbi:MAG TPA: hypothetical protein VG984_03000 [Candidatus Paceibacterota bacterium]|nr:hypothetical protein [Candidatus Paceibacterota bacterium]